MSLLNSASLVVTPNGYKEGTLYSVIPNTTLGVMTVVRATTATRVNSAGLIELVPYNLLQYSEQFNNAAWGILNSASVSANTTNAPNGTLTADTLTFSANSSSSIYQAISSPAGETTLSIYAKTASGTKQFRLRIDSPGGNTSSDFTATTQWQRFDFSLTTGAAGVNFYIINDNAGTAGSIFIWGAQLNIGSTAKDYFRTETRLNIPRLDYSNGTCPSILVEPQRTNLMTYSEQLDNAAWTATAITVTANATTSPDGTTNADKLIPTNVSAFHNLYNYAAVLTGNYSFSVFVKKGGYNFVSLQDQFSGVFNSCFDLVNGTVTTFVGSSNIKSYGNDWFLCSVTGNGVGTTVIPSIVPANAISSFPIFTGNGTDGIFAWGAQFEAGAYPTSYIPTTSAAVTRNADQVYKTGISALIGQTEGTVFVEGYVQNGQESMMFWIKGDTGIYTDFITLIFDTSRVPILSVYNGGVLQAYIVGSAVSQGFHKVAVGYANNDFVGYVDGVQIGTDSSGTPPTCSQLFIDQYTDGGVRNVSKKQATLFPTRLTNAELISLTT